MQSETRILLMPSPHHPGGGKFHHDHAIALSEQGYRVDILENLVVESTHLKFPRLGKGYTLDTGSGIRTFRGAYRKLPYQALRNIRDWTGSTLKLYDKYCRKLGDPDIILAFSSVWTGYAASEIKDRYGIPYILTEHRSRFTALRQEALDMIKEPHHAFLEPAFRNASAVISVSQALNTTIRKFCEEGKEIHIIPNLVDTECFKPPEERAMEPFHILSIGRLESEKGMDILIQAFDLFSELHQDAVLHIVGAGSLEQELKAMASHANAPERILFTPSLDRKEILETIHEASILALTSRFEAFGLVLAEAMATGLPVLATRCGGPGYIVPPEAGILAECESVPSVFVGLKNMHSRYSQFKPEKIRKYAVKNFSKKVVAGAYDKLIREVLSE